MHPEMNYESLVIVAQLDDHGPRIDAKRQILSTVHYYQAIDYN